MIDSDELLAIGAALVETVRSQIKYSENMNQEGQLFDGFGNTYLHKSLKQNTIKVRSFNRLYKCSSKSIRISYRTV